MQKLKLMLLISLISTSMYCQEQKTMSQILTEYTFKAHRISLDSLNISYIKEGKGDTILLFVHGLSSNSDAWSKNIDNLSQTYTCIALDLPGYGKSSKPNTDYTPSFFAKTIHSFIENLNLGKVILIGHSMGGQASIKYATLYPKNVEKLILVAPAGLEKFTDLEAQTIKNLYTPNLVKNTSEEQIKTNYALNFYNQPEGVTKMIKDRIQIKTASDFDAHCAAIVKSIAGMLDEPVHNTLKTINHNTLVIFGKNDMLIPNRYFHPTLTIEDVGKIALNEIKSVQLKYVDQAGHFVQFEKSSAVNKLIQDFIEQQ